MVSVAPAAWFPLSRRHGHGHLSHHHLSHRHPPPETLMDFPLYPDDEVINSPFGDCSGTALHTDEQPFLNKLEGFGQVEEAESFSYATDCLTQSSSSTSGYPEPVEPQFQKMSKIRLIRIQPSESLQAELQCSFIDASPTDRDNDIVEHYSALSYDWGDQDDLQTYESQYAVTGSQTNSPSWDCCGSMSASSTAISIPSLAGYASLWTIALNRMVGTGIFVPYDIGTGMEPIWKDVANMVKSCPPSPTLSSRDFVRAACNLMSTGYYQTKISSATSALIAWFVFTAGLWLLMQSMAELYITMVDRPLASRSASFIKLGSFSSALLFTLHAALSTKTGSWVNWMLAIAKVMMVLILGLATLRWANLSSVECRSRAKSSKTRVNMPHITVEVPVYRSGLVDVIRPTVTSLRAAIALYEKLGGTASIFKKNEILWTSNDDMILETDFEVCMKSSDEKSNKDNMQNTSARTHTHDGQTFDRREYGSALNRTVRSWLVFSSSYQQRLGDLPRLGSSKLSRTFKIMPASI